MSSIVIDTCVMRLYNAPLDPKYMELFKWLTTSGELYITQKLINEYLGTQNRNVNILLTQLLRNSEESSASIYPRAVKISKKILIVLLTTNDIIILATRKMFIMQN